MPKPPLIQSNLGSPRSSSLLNYEENQRTYGSSSRKNAKSSALRPTDLEQSRVQRSKGPRENGRNGVNSRSHSTSGSRYRSEDLDARRQRSSPETRLPRPSASRKTCPGRKTANRASESDTFVSQKSYSWSKLDLSQLDQGNSKTQVRTEVVLSMRQSNVLLSPRVYNSVTAIPSSSSEDLPSEGVAQSRRSRIQQVTMGPIETDSMCDVFFQSEPKHKLQNLKSCVTRPNVPNASRSLDTISKPSKSSKYSMQEDVPVQRTHIPIMSHSQNRKTSPRSRNSEPKLNKNVSRRQRSAQPVIQPSGSSAVTSGRSLELSNGKENIQISTQTKKVQAYGPSRRERDTHLLSSRKDSLDERRHRIDYPLDLATIIQPSASLNTKQSFAEHGKSSQTAGAHYIPEKSLLGMGFERSPDLRDHSSLDGSVTPFLQDRAKIHDTIQEADIEHHINQRFLAGLKASEKSFVKGLRTAQNGGKVSDFSVDTSSDFDAFPESSHVSRTQLSSSPRRHHDEEITDLSDSLHVSELDDRTILSPQLGAMWHEDVSQQVLHSPRFYNKQNASPVFETEHDSSLRSSHAPNEDAHQVFYPPHIYKKGNPYPASWTEPSLRSSQGYGAPIQEAFYPSPRKQVHFKDPISISKDISSIISLEDLGLESEQDPTIHENRNTELEMRSGKDRGRPTSDARHVRTSVNHTPQARTESHLSSSASRQLSANSVESAVLENRSTSGQNAEHDKDGQDTTSTGSTLVRKNYTNLPKTRRDKAHGNSARQGDKSPRRFFPVPGPLTTSILLQEPQSYVSESSKNSLQNQNTLSLERRFGSNFTQERSELNSIAVLRDERLQKVIDRSPPKHRQNILFKSRYFKIWRQNVRLQMIVKDRERRKLMKAMSFHALTSVAKHFFSWRTHLIKQQIAADEMYCYHLIKKGFTALRWATDNKKFKTNQAQSGRRRIKLRSCFRKWKQRYHTRRIENLRETFSHWKIRCRNKMIVDLFATRRKRIDILQSFFFWRVKFHSSVHLRMATEHYDRTLQRKAWHLWRIYAAEKVVRNSQKEVAVIKHESWVLSRSLERWKRTTIQVQYAKMYCNKKIQTAHMKRWKHFTSLARIQHQKEVNIARETRKKHLVQSHFKLWIQELKMTRFRRELQHKVTRNCTVVWKSQLEKHRIICTEIISHHNYSLLKRSFLAIFEYAKDRKISRAHAVQKLEVFMKQKSLIAWHNFTMRKVKLRNMQKTFYFSKMKKNMQSLFMKWKFQLQAILFMQEQQMQWTLSCVQKAANKWLHLLRLKQMGRLCVKQIVAGKKKILRGLFATWKRQLNREKRSDDRAIECRVLLLREKTRRLLRHWNIRTQESQNIRPFIERLDRKRIGRFFDAWALLRNRQVIKEKMNQQIHRNSLRQCFLIWKEKLEEANDEKSAEEKYEVLLTKRALKGWKEYTARCRSYTIISNQNQRMLLLRSFYVWATKTTFKQIQESQKIHQHFIEQANAHEILLRWRSATKQRQQDKEQAISQFKERHDLSHKRSKFNLWCQMFREQQKAKFFASEKTKQRLRAVLNAWHIIASDSLRERMEQFTSSIKSLRKQQILSKSTQSDHDITIGHDVITQTSFEDGDVLKMTTNTDFANNTVESRHTENSSKVTHVDPTMTKLVSSNQEIHSPISSLSGEEATQNSDVVSVVMTNGGADSGILLRDYVSTATSKHIDDTSSTSSIDINGSPVYDQETSGSISGGVQTFDVTTGILDVVQRPLTMADLTNTSASDISSEASSNQCKTTQTAKTEKTELNDSPVKKQDVCYNGRAEKLNDTTVKSQQTSTSESHTPSCSLSDNGDEFLQPILQDLSHMSALPIAENFSWHHMLDERNGKLSPKSLKNGSNKDSSFMELKSASIDEICHFQSNGMMPPTDGEERNIHMGHNGNVGSESDMTDSPLKIGALVDHVPKVKDCIPVASLSDSKNAFENGHRSPQTNSPIKDQNVQAHSNRTLNEGSSIDLENGLSLSQTKFQTQDQNNQACVKRTSEDSTNTDFQNGLRLSDGNGAIEDQCNHSDVKSILQQNGKTPVLTSSEGPIAVMGYGDSIEKAEVYSPKLVTDKSVGEEIKNRDVPIQPVLSSSLRDMSVDTEASATEECDNDFSFSDVTSSSSDDVIDDVMEPASLEILKKRPRPTLPVHPCLRDSKIPTTEWLVRLAVIRLRYRPLAFAFHQWRLLIHEKKWNEEMIAHMRKRRTSLSLQENFGRWKFKLVLLRIARAHHNRVKKKLCLDTWVSWTRQRRMKNRMKALAEDHYRLKTLRKCQNIWNQKLERKLALLEILKYWQTKTRKHNSPRVKDARFQHRKQQELMADCFISWKLQAKQIVMAGKHRNIVIATRCFSAWRQWCVEKSSIKQRCNEAYSHNLKTKVFVAWRRHVLLMKVVKMKQSLATRNWISHLLNRWHEYSQVRSYHRNAINCVSSSNTIKTTESCFNVWKEELTKHKLANVMHRRSLMRKFIHAWHDVTIEGVTYKQKFDHIHDMVEKHSKHEVVLVWLDQLILKSKINSMRQHHLLSLVLKTWNTWKEKVVMRRAARTYSKFLMRRTFNGWKKFLQQRQKYNEKARTVLLKWHEMVVKNQVLSTMADEFQSKARTLTLEITFNTWVIARELSVKAKLHHTNKIVGKHIVAWHQWSKCKKNLRKIQNNYVTQRRKELFAISWHKWKYRYQVRLRNSNVVAVHKRAVAFRTLRQFWLLWKQRQQEQASEKIYRNSLLRKSFMKWSSLHQKLKRADRFAEELEIMRLKRVLFSWASYTLAVKNERKIISDLRESREKILTISTYMTWLKSFRNMKLANTFREEKIKRRALASLKEWKNEQKRLQACYEQAVQLVESTMLKFYFTQWKSMFRKVRMLEVTCDEIATVKRNTLLRKSWKKWFKAKEKRDLQRLHQRDLASEAVKKWRSYASNHVEKRRIRDKRSVMVERFTETWICRRSFGKWKRDYLVRWFTQKARINLINRSWTSWTRKTSMIIYAREMHEMWTIQKYWVLWRLELVTKRAADQAMKDSSLDLMKKVFRNWRAHTHERRTGHRLSSVTLSPRTTETSTTPRKKSRIPILKK